MVSLLMHISKIKISLKAEHTELSRKDRNPDTPELLGGKLTVTGRSLIWFSTFMY